MNTRATQLATPTGLHHNRTQTISAPALVDVLVQQASKRKLSNSPIAATFVSYDTEDDYLKYHPFLGQVPPFTGYCAAIEEAIFSSKLAGKSMRHSILSARDYAASLEAQHASHSPNQLNQFVLNTGAYFNYCICSDDPDELRLQSIATARKEAEPYVCFQGDLKLLLHASSIVQQCRAKTYSLGCVEFIDDGTVRIDLVDHCGKSRTSFGEVLTLSGGRKALFTWAYTFNELEDVLAAEVKRLTKSAVVVESQRRALRARPARITALRGSK